MSNKLNKPIHIRIISSEVVLSDEILDREYSFGDRTASNKIKELTEYLNEDSERFFGWRSERRNRTISWYLIVN